MKIFLEFPMNGHDACLYYLCTIHSHIFILFIFHKSLIKSMMIIEIKKAATIPIITFILKFFHLKIHIIVGIFSIDK